MRIRDVRVESSGRGAEAIGRFEWEDSDRSPVEIHFRVDESLGSSLSAGIESFLLAGYFPARHHGESRIAVEIPADPRLTDGLLGAGRLLQLWYGGSLPRIESPPGWQARDPLPSQRTGSFLTGGVDSLHALWTNHRLYPAEHPAFVRESLFVFGVEMPGEEDAPAASRRLAKIRPYLERAAGSAGVGLLQLDTNVRRLEPDVDFWAWQYAAAPIAAAAHALAGRFSRILLGSSYDYRNLVPWGTHPLLDPLMSSSRLSIEHTGAATHRLDKLRELCRWPGAIEGLLVCANSPAETVNCGTCSKCLRAMVELIAASAPQPETLPPLEELRPDQIDA
ncbi:MAG: hypothetical protein ACRD16_00615, partial [Thermoanaerobaculia bacterium]